MAALAASLSSCGQPKSGKPCARLIAPCAIASRVISRMTDSVNVCALLLTNVAHRHELVFAGLVVLDEMVAAQFGEELVALVGAGGDQLVVGGEDDFGAWPVQV